MKIVMNHGKDGWLLKMISRTDPVIINSSITQYQKHHNWITMVLKIPYLKYRWIRMKGFKLLMSLL